ncbi:hypothetical protein BROUX41_005084 [Berkeleyomyces rouxiae]
MESPTTACSTPKLIERPKDDSQNEAGDDPNQFQHSSPQELGSDCDDSILLRPRHYCPPYCRSGDDESSYEEVDGDFNQTVNTLSSSSSESLDTDTTDVTEVKDDGNKPELNDGPTIEEIDSSTPSRCSSPYRPHHSSWQYSSFQNRGHPGGRGHDHPRSRYHDYSTESPSKSRHHLRTREPAKAWDQKPIFSVHVSLSEVPSTEFSATWNFEKRVLTFSGRVPPLTLQKGASLISSEIPDGIRERSIKLPSFQSSLNRNNMLTVSGYGIKTRPSPNRNILTIDVPVLVVRSTSGAAADI